jgi:hypothetical protein
MDMLTGMGFPSSMFVAVSTLPSPTIKRKMTSNGTFVQKAKEDITCYKFGNSYNVSWDNRIITPQDTSLPKYYIIKNKNWYLDVKLQGLKTITDKSMLSTYCREFGISTDDVILAPEKEVKKLEARGVISFASYINANHSLSWVDNNEVLMITSYAHRNNDVVTNDLFKNLSDTNPVKQFIIKICELRKKYAKVMNVVKYKEGYNHAESYRNPCRTTDILTSKILGAWGTDLTDFLTLAKAIEK